MGLEVSEEVWKALLASEPMQLHIGEGGGGLPIDALIQNGHVPDFVHFLVRDIVKCDDCDGELVLLGWATEVVH